MPSYTLPNTVAGGSVTVNAPSLGAAQQVAANQTGASLSQQQGGGTFGVNTNPNDPALSGGSSGGGSTGGGGGTSQDLAKISAGFAASAGMSQKQLDEQIRQFDLTLEWQKKMWEQQGLPQLVIQQRAADLEEKKFAELTQQATRQQNFVEEIGRRQAALAEKTQADANAIAQGQLGLGQSQLGLNTLQAAAGLSGPEDWIQAANFARGVQGSNLPAFIQQLLGGGSTATMGGPAPGGQMSNPLTLGGLATSLGAGATGPGTGGTPAGPGSAATDPGLFGGPYRPGLPAPSVSENVGAGLGRGGAPASAPGLATSGQDPGFFGGPYRPGLPPSSVAEGLTPDQIRAARAASPYGIGGDQSAFQPSQPRGTGSDGSDFSAIVQGGPSVYTQASAPLPGSPTDQTFRQYYDQRMGALAPQTLDRYTAPTSNVDYAAQQLRQVYQQGGNALAPQALEGLSPTEMAMFTGGGGAVGADVPGFLEQYKRSRIGQMASLPGMF